jgi:DNA repair protein RadC
MYYNRSELQKKLYEIYCSETIKVSTPMPAVNKLKKYASKNQEYFLVITLDGGHGLIRVHEITKGIANKTLVHPREVFRPAIIDGACGVIIAHNHPSGDVKPSTEDHNVTRIMKQAGEIIGISVLDHIIVSKYGYYSFMESGTF